MQFFQQLYSDADKNSGEKFDNNFLVKIANKGTSLTTPSNSSIHFGLPL